MRKRNFVMRGGALGIFTLLAISGASIAAENSDGCGAISSTGYCGVKFGMSAEEAIGAFRGTLAEPDYDLDTEEEGCYYLSDETAGEAFMVLSGAVERVDVFQPGIYSSTGAEVGMNFDDVAALYPGAARKPNPYTYPTEDLHVELGDGAFAVFEQDQGRIIAFRIGRKPAIEYIEGCS